MTPQNAKPATYEVVRAARTKHQSVDIEIDDDTLMSEAPGQGGLWVQAWVWVDDQDVQSTLETAGPDMLAALRSVLASVPFASYRGDGELEECERAVRAAIAKATGE